MGKARQIYDKAKEEIINHIRYEVSLIHHAQVTEDEGEEGHEYVTEADFPTHKRAGISIEVQDPYTGDYCTEYRIVTEVQNEDDGSVTIYTDVEDEELSSKEIDLVGLTEIAEVLEESYKILCSNK